MSSPTKQRKQSPHRARWQQVYDANLGVPEHDRVSLLEASRRENALLSSEQAVLQHHRELEEQEKRRQEELVAALAKLESDDEDDASAGQAPKPRVHRRIAAAAGAAAAMQAHSYERGALEAEWTEFRRDSSVALTQEDRRVLLGRDALVNLRHEQNEEAAAHDVHGMRAKMLEYSTVVSTEHSPRRSAAVKATTHDGRAVHPTAWVSRASGKPPPPPRVKPPPDTQLREAHHQPPLAFVSGIVGFGDGSTIERVDTTAPAVAEQSAPPPLLLPSLAGPSQVAGEPDKTADPSSKSVQSPSASHCLTLNDFMQWNRRIVQLVGTMQLVIADKEARNCERALNALASGESGSALTEAERWQVMATSFNNIGLVRARSLRPLAALEAFEKALAAEESAFTSARRGGGGGGEKEETRDPFVPSASTMLNIAAVLTDLRRFREARAIAQMLVRATVRTTTTQDIFGDDDAFPAPSAGDPDMETVGWTAAQPSEGATGEQQQAAVVTVVDVGEPAAAHFVVLAHRQIAICDEALRQHASNSSSRRRRSGAGTDRPLNSRSRPRSTRTRDRPWRHSPTPYAKTPKPGMVPSTYDHRSERQLVDVSGVSAISHAADANTSAGSNTVANHTRHAHSSALSRSAAVSARALTAVEALLLPLRYRRDASGAARGGLGIAEPATGVNGSRRAASPGGEVSRLTTAIRETRSNVSAHKRRPPSTHMSVHRAPSTAASYSSAKPVATNAMSAVHEMSVAKLGPKHPATLAVKQMLPPV